MKSNRSFTRIALFAFFAFVSSSCEESLPPRDEPQAFLEATIEGLAGPVVVDSVQPTSVEGSFSVTLRNLYDEVLQGEALVRVDVDVWMKNHPERRGFVRFGKEALMNNSIINANTITIGPDSAAFFLKQWSHMTTDSIPFWQFVNLTRKWNSHGEPYFESDPVSFVAEASVQVFRNVQPERARTTEFTVTYYIF